MARKTERQTGEESKIETEQKQSASPSKQLHAALMDKEHKKHHYNYQKTVDYTVSSGSLKFDYIIDGGLRPGVHRFTGITEGGKTASSFGFMRNFLTSQQNAFGMYFQAERKMSNTMFDRADIKFVENAEEWESGTCFVYSGNTYEYIFRTIQSLVFDNPSGAKYFFIIDSLDALVTEDSNTKDYGDAQKVAGGAVMAGLFLKRMSLAMSKLGHICILINQVRSAIQIDPYAQKEYRQTNASGGNAVQHFNDFCFEFLPRYKTDLIFEDGDDKKEILGHNCKIIIRKSTNESTNKKISYPIRYKQKGDKVMWKSREVFDFLRMFEKITRTGSWYTFSPDVVKTINDGKIECPEKFQGEKSIYDYFDDNPQAVNILADIFKKILVQQPTTADQLETEPDA